MANTDHARDLALFLAPMLAGVSGASPEYIAADDPGGPDLADRTRPDIDLAVRFVLEDVLGGDPGLVPQPAVADPPRVASQLPAADQPTASQPHGQDEITERLNELLNGNEQAVRVLWALLAGCDDEPHPGLLRLAEASRADDGGGGDGPPGGLRGVVSGGRMLLRFGRYFHANAWIQRKVAGVWMNALIAAVLFVAWWLAWPPLHVRPLAGVLTLEAFAVWSLAFLPGWLYIRFLGLRAGALWVEYVLNLHRLGWDRPRYLPRPPKNSEFYADWFSDGGALLDHRPNIYRQKFDAYYGKSVSRSGHGDGPSIRIETLFPVFLTTVTFAACWTAVLWNPHFASNPTTVWDALKFGFLGAYSFDLQMLIRRFFQSDLRPAAYANAMQRIIVVFILVTVLYQLLPSGSQRTVAIVAFIVGFFPLVGMQALQGSAAAALRAVVPSLSPSYPLNQIDGLSIWYEARLLEEGIEDMQSLATANFVDVILHTRVPVGRLVDWVDQAHLYLHLDRIERTWRERSSAKHDKKPAPSHGPTRDFSPGIAAGSVTASSRAGTRTRTALRQLGIRKATDLLKAFPPERLDPDLAAAPGSPWADYMTSVSGGQLDEAQLSTIVRVLDHEPSLAPVWNWHERGVRRTPAGR
jgi:hypothetical protein